MGDSLPPPAAIDLVGSYARRRGAEVEVVLAAAPLALTDGAVVTFARGGRTVVGRGAVTEPAGVRTFTVRAARDRFADGVWALTVTTETGAAERIDARLLVQGDRPLVLLWGAAGRPSVVPKASGSPAKASVARRKQAAAAGGRVLERALSVLPEPQAKALRGRARTVARRVLS